MTASTSTTITHRYDFVYLFDVTDGNPNGDPDAGNQPRLDPETGEGLVTDVCIKRKVRNFVSITKRNGDATLSGYDIYVKERGILANEQRRAYEAVKAEPGDRPNEMARKWMCQTFFDIRAFGAVMTTGKVEDGEAKKPARQAKQRPEGGEEEQPAAEPARSRKPKTRQWNCGQVRGPVQLTFARSVLPILSLEHAITRCALTNASDTGREAGEGDDGKAATLQMGRKMTVPYALYRCHGFVSPHLAADTGFAQPDLDLLWRALTQMFEHDRSATRGQMSARGLYVFKHQSALGNAPSHRLQRMVRVERTGSGPVRSFADFTVSVPGKADLPAGVELLTFDCDSFAADPVVVQADAGGAP